MGIRISRSFSGHIQRVKSAVKMLKFNMRVLDTDRHSIGRSTRFFFCVHRFLTLHAQMVKNMEES